MLIAGETTHLSRISFCVNNSATAPPSPIPTSLPIRVYPEDKGMSCLAIRKLYRLLEYPRTKNVNTQNFAYKRGVVMKFARLT